MSKMDSVNFLAPRDIFIRCLILEIKRTKYESELHEQGLHVQVLRLVVNCARESFVVL